jgi:hypothetical protein
MKIQPTLPAVALLLLLNCSEADSARNSEPVDPGSDERCSAASGTTGDPKTIYELLELINGLPRPVTLPCLLESLDRPLSLNANFNTQSAQPALGKRSPRIFIILNESLSMSLVPGGEGTLEFGARTADEPGVSVKGELHFPVEDELAPDDAFVRLAPAESTGLTLQQATSCGVCHDNERPAPAYPFPGAFASAIVKPAPFFAVDVAAIQHERDTCDSAAEPERCAVLEAMFDHGDVVQTPFP